MSRSLLEQVKRYISTGRMLQDERAWKEARHCYLAAAGLMLEIADSGDERSKTIWLIRAKALRQVAAKLAEAPEHAPNENGVPHLLAANHVDTGDLPAQKSIAQKTVAQKTIPSSDDPWLIGEMPTVSFDDVAGYETVKEEIRLTLLYPFSHAEAASYYRIDGGGGIILYGPPGVGKTHFARAVAGELGLPFFWVKSSDILSKYVGESEQNIAKLFAAARGHERAIILIDEVEKLMPARNETASPVMPRVVGQLLEEMNGFAQQKSMLLLIGNTNVPWLIDDAFLNPRRFARQIYIPLPDAAARQQIMHLHLHPVPYDESIRLDELAEQLDGYSGADLAEICRRARAFPFLEVVRGGALRAVARQDMVRAIAQVKPTVTRATVQRFDAYARGRAEMQPGPV
jgi:transitional endoplasmic reticulum ATPase